MSYLIPCKHSGWTHEMKRHLNGSGGGGSSGERPATEEEKRLWGAQATSLEQMNDIAMPTLRTGMNNLGSLTNDAMNGTLAANMRNQAGADAGVALGTSLNDMKRVGGFDPTLRGGQDAMAQWGLGAAKQRVGSMNQATLAAEDQKWQRNAALTGLASGQGNSAVQGMGSLASQITADRNASNNMAMQNQSNNTAGMTGLGMMGAYMMKKDGGEVRLKDGSGGLQMFRPVSPTTPAPFTFSSDTTSNDGPGMAGGVMSAAAPVMATNMAAKALDKVGIGAPKKALDGVVSSAKDVVSSLGTNSTFAPIAEEKALEAAGTFGGENAAWAAGELAADAELAGSATTAAATEGFGAALGAAAPWLAGGYALGSMLDLWADGGTVPKEGGLRRKDMTRGGKVNGPGTSVSDSIPARLSDGEYVLNEGAVKMIGKDKLDAINSEGLKYRSEEPKFAMGGLAALGHMARGFVPTAMQLDEQSKNEVFRQEQLGLMKNADSRAQGQFNVTMEDRTNRIAKEKKISEKISEWVPRMNGMGEIIKQHEAGQISDGDFVNALAPSYTSIVNDGKSLQRLQNGNFALTEGSGPRAKYTELSAKDAASMLKSQGMQQQVFQQMFSELAAIDHSYAEKAYRVFNDQLTHSGQRADKAQAQSNWETTQRFNETKHAEEMKLRERGLRIQEGQAAKGKQHLVPVYDKDTGEQRMVMVDTAGMKAGDVVKTPDGTTLNKPSDKTDERMKQVASEYKQVTDELEFLQKNKREGEVFSFGKNDPENQDNARIDALRNRAQALNDQMQAIRMAQYLPKGSVTKADAQGIPRSVPKKVSSEITPEEIAATEAARKDAALLREKQLAAEREKRRQAIAALEAQAEVVNSGLRAR